mmetsp:Transcript_46440/g.68626  ORF Transcript_46440/g.68626 Transcript_46440/m.68626 type:complete len:304 (+) Transcript_46440:25-936(+)
MTATDDSSTPGRKSVLSNKNVNNNNIKSPKKGKDRGVIKSILIEQLSRKAIAMLKDGMDDEDTKAAAAVTPPSDAIPAINTNQEASLERVASRALADLLHVEKYDYNQKIPAPKLQRHLSFNPASLGVTSQHQQQQQLDNAPPQHLQGIPLKLFNLAKWQLDLYLSGKPHAVPANTSSNDDRTEPPNTSPSLAQTQLVHLCSWFIPSQTVQNSLIPTLTWLPSEQGALRKPVINAICATLPMSQPSLDAVMKSNVDWIFTNEDWKVWAKNQMMKTTTTFTDSSSGAAAGTDDSRARSNSTQWY